MESSTNCIASVATGWRHLFRGLPLTKYCHPNSWRIKLCGFKFRIGLVSSISLIVGCFGMAVSASVYSFFAWQNAMRAILNQTETESNLVATIGNLGMTLAFPAGMSYEIFGNQMPALLAACFFAIGYFFLWLGTGQWRSHFAGHPWITDILYFFVGFGGSFTYMATMMPNVENFPYEQRGKVIGLLDASLSLGPTLLSVLYNSAFTDGHIQEGEEALQNLSGYFLTIGIVAVAVNLVIVLFVGRVPKTPQGEGVATEISPVLEHDSLAKANQLRDSEEESEQSEPYYPRGDNEYEPTPPSDFSEFPFEELHITRVIFRWSFWFLLGQYVFNACLQLTYQNNIATYLKSFKLTEYNLLFTVLNTSVQTLSKFAAGIVSDEIAQRRKSPRAVVFIIPYILQTAILIISAFIGDNFVVMMLTCIIVGIANGVTWCQTPTLIGELFGTSYMGSNWGWTMLVTAGLGFPFTIAFSQIYEAAIEPPGSSSNCYGLTCFTWSFVMLAGASFVTVILAAALTQNMYENKRWRSLYSPSTGPTAHGIDIKSISCLCRYGTTVAAKL